MTAATVVVPVLMATAAKADTTPPAGVPATVSADPLPTVQINGVVWAQVVVGNTVYVTGDFTSARPAGSPLGTNETPRGNLLAYDITTGNLITSFNHSLNALGKTITASPDGSRVYVGGNFTAVDGQAHYRIAAFATATGNLIDSFSAGVDAGIYAVVATNSAVYAGGAFSNANGSARTRLAAFTTDGTLTTWAPTANAAVNAMLVAPGGSKIVVAGSFTQLSGASYYGMGALDAITGAKLAWASTSASYPIQDHSTAASITSLVTDGSKIYVTAYAYTNGNFEGRAAISPNDGSLIWLNDCHGDTYSSFPVGQVLYSVSHAHDCEPAGAYPEAPANKWHRALADTTYATGTNGPATNGYPSFQGQPRSDQLDWYPTLTPGTYTGQTQAAWSITGNSDYISLGGEFPYVDGIAQQGLVRYAVTGKAPNKVGPRGYAGYPVVNTPVAADGTSTLTWPATWDEDNAVLTYSIYRNNSARPVYQTTANSRFWILPTMTWKDSGLLPGSNPVYRLIVTDSFGNATYAGSLINDNSPRLTYAGSWSTTSATSAYGGDLHTTSSNGASVSLTYTGDSIAVVAPTVVGGATASASIDGGAPAEISFVPPAGSTAAAQQNVYVTFGLAPGTHTIKITKTGGGTLQLDGVFAPGGSNLPGKLTFSGTSAPFGSIGRARSATSTVTVNNSGGTDVTITAVTLPAAPFSVANPLKVGQVLPAGASLTQTITYSPTQPSSDTGTYSVTGDDGQGATAIALSASNGLASTTVNDNDSSIAYSSGWSTSTGRGVGDYQNDVSYATANGSSATFTFTGTGATFLTEKYSDEGNATVSVDGGAPTTVNMVAATRAAQQAVFTVGGLPNATHTIKITKTSGTYLLVDGFTSTSLLGTVPASSTYGQRVLAAAPSSFWRLDEASGTVAADYAGSSNLTEGAGVTHNTAGAIAGDADTADTFSGTSTGWAQSTVVAAAPNTFTAQAWFKTATTKGGKIIGYGNGANGTASTSNDRNVYMDNAGHLIFGVYPNAVVTIASPLTYNDNAWHQVSASLSTSAGIALYVDGALVASNTATTTAQQYSGFWHVGGDTLAGWASVPTSYYFAGAIDEAAVYPTALAAAQIKALYVNNAPPAAAFTAAANGLAVSFDGKGSADPDGPIAGYAWSFGDGATGVGATATHTYTASGSYNATLTVTDNKGATASVAHTVSVVAPNKPPVATFSPNTANLTVSVDGTASTDPDGKIASFAWKFGDGATGSGATASHTYAAAGSYTVTLTVTDNQGATATSTGIVKVGTVAAALSDAFGRTIAGNWGPADIGGDWTTSWPSSSFNVNGGLGHLTMTGPGDGPTAILSTVSKRNLNLLLDFSMSKAATGNGAFLSVLLRQQSTGDDYRLKVRYVTGGGVHLAVSKVVNRTETTLREVDVPGLSVAAGTPLRIRAVINGNGTTTITGAVWAIGTPEPAAPQITQSDSEPALQALGAVGVQAYLSGSSTNAPVNMDLDNLTASDI